MGRFRHWRLFSGLIPVAMAAMLSACTVSPEALDQQTVAEFAAANLEAVTANQAVDCLFWRGAAEG